MSALTLFAMGFAAAAALCACGFSAGWIILLVSAAAVGVVAALIFRKRLPFLGIAALVCAGIMAAGCWYLIFSRFYLKNAVEMDGETRTVTFEAEDYSYATDYGSAVDCTIKLEGKTYHARVYLDDDLSLAPGDCFTGLFRFRVTTPGGREDATYHQGKGIFLLAYQEEELTDLGSHVTWRHQPAILRQRIKVILKECFPDDVYAFTQALLLGDGDELSYETDTAFKLSGIRHIIAVSGLHVAILYGLLSTLTLKRRFVTAVLGLPALLLFAAVAGFTPSVTRACIMIGLMILSMAFNREYDPPTALGFSTVLMLIANPLTITSAGFQLSVASVAGIFLFQKPLQQWLLGLLGKKDGILGKLGWGIASSVSVSLSATVLTTPLSAYYFGAVSIVGVLTNLLTLWVVSFVFYGIIAACVTSLLWSAGAVMLAKIVAMPIRYVLLVSKALAGLPLAAVYTRSPYIIAWLVLFYLLLAAFLIMPRKQPIELGCCAVLGLCLALLAGWTEPLLDECRVTVLDVGQGQSILLQSEGRTYLVDCGGDREDETADIIAETLLSQGVNRLDGIILTHYDKDHSGALANLLTRVDTDLLLIPGVDSDAVDRALEALEEDTVIWVTEDIEITCGDTVLTVYGPLFAEESNENSLCVLFSTENCDILITGDRSAWGERQLIKHTDLPQVELLIVGHHGSKYSTCMDLLRAVEPEMAIISAGEGNPYGHPTQEVLDRLLSVGCPVYRTDINGTVIFRR